MDTITSEQREQATMRRLAMLRSRVAAEPELQPLIDITIAGIQGAYLPKPGPWVERQKPAPEWLQALRPQRKEN